MTESADPTPAPLERRMLAIMATDVVGYSRRMEADEAGTIARITALRTEVLTPLLERHRGRLVKLMGDGALVVFESVVDAVACGAAVQRAVAERNAVRPETERLVLRIGINLGDVVLLENDVYGDGVNVAARLEQLCDPGGVMVSGTAYDHLQGKLGFPLEFAGEQRVKNIQRPVRAYRARLDGRMPRRMPRLPIRTVAAVLGVLVLAGSGAALWWPKSDESARPPLLVLPFRHLGDDRQAAELARSLPEEITAELARFRTADLIAPDRAAAEESASGSSGSARGGARYLLRGSVQGAPNRLRITTELVDAQRDREVWAERWERAGDDLLAVQAEVAGAVASRVASPYSGAIVRADRDLARAKPPERRTPYDLYLLGMEARERGDPAGLAEALGLLEQSTAQDPGFSRGWSGLAAAHGDLSALEGYPPEREAAREAAARKAIELDPDDAVAHAVMATVYVDKGEPERARAEFGKALALNPASADLLAIYAGWASDVGEPERGLAAADRALALDPALPAWAVGNFAYAYFMVGDYARALALIDGLPAESYTPAVYVYRAAALGALGRAAEARRAVELALAHNPGLSAEAFAAGYATTADQQERLIETMRAAGFPVCATGAEPVLRSDRPRLAECAAS